MECLSSLVAGVSKSDITSVVPADCGKAKEFADMVDQPGRDTDVYVNGKSDVGARNPLTELMQQFQSMNFSPKTAESAEDKKHASRAGDSEGAETAAIGIAQSVLVAQAEMLRTAMMMEVMSTTKQGVTTLFQQQG
jgi:hypothetical protein